MLHAIFVASVSARLQTTVTKARFSFGILERQDFSWDFVRYVMWMDKQLHCQMSHLHTLIPDDQGRLVIMHTPDGTEARNRCVANRISRVTSFTPSLNSPSSVFPCGQTTQTFHPSQTTITIWPATSRPSRPRHNHISHSCS